MVKYLIFFGVDIKDTENVTEGAIKIDNREKLATYGIQACKGETNIIFMRKS
jgi:hypothetical protein